MWRLLLLIAPLVLAVRALITGKVEHKVTVTLTALLLVLLTVPGILGRNAAVLAVAGALAASAVGDWLLSTKGEKPGRFVPGIQAFLVAHVGYIIYSGLSGGRPEWITLAAAAAAYLLYFFAVLTKRVRPLGLAASALAYLLVSCVALSMAVALPSTPAIRALFISGVALILFSDTVISFVEFLGWKRWSPLILPTYYLAQLSLVASVMLLA